MQVTDLLMDLADNKAHNATKHIYIVQYRMMTEICGLYVDAYIH